MKFLKTLMAALVVATTFMSCSKDDDPAPSNPYAGNYKGKYGNDNDVPGWYYYNQLKSNGTVYEEGGNELSPNKGNGTWSINGTTFTSKVTYYQGSSLTYSMTGTYDPVLKKITGTWGYDNSNTDGGTFYLVKQ